MKFQNKSISPVVAIALLLVTSVVAVVGFQNWFVDYSSAIQADAESSDVVGGNIKVNGVFGNNLYLYSDGDVNLTVLKVTDKDGSEMCSFGGDDVDSTGLVGWWDLDSDNYADGVVADKSPFGNNGTVYGASLTTGVLGESDGAMLFDGNDDYIDCGNDSNLDITEGITVSAWIKKHELVNYYQRIVAKQYQIDQTTANSCFQLGINRDDEFRWAVGGAFDSSPSSLIIQPAKWYNFIGTYNKTHYVFYLDGDISYSTPDIGTFRINPTQILTIGGTDYNGIQQYFFKGSIADVRIYNRSLTAQEVKQLYWTTLKQQKQGVNEIDISTCNLQKGDKYQITIFTKNQKVEEYVIKK